ncbi:MAG: hypothetical protein HOY78_02200 [Saccharothrix sp.]|nr:hypothetical protein [Saccharothrix sp.]
MTDDEVEQLRAEVERLKREGSPGVVHEIDQAFHDLAIRQRDHAWVQVERLQRENAALRAQTNPSQTEASGTEPQRFPMSPLQTNLSQSTVDAIACASVSPGAAVPCCGRHLPDGGGMWKHQSADGSLTWIDLTHPAGPVWGDDDPEPDPRPTVVMTPDGRERIYAEDWGGWVLRNESPPGEHAYQWEDLPRPIVQVLPAHLRPLGERPR